MKKALLLLAVMFTASTIYSQTINQASTWPDATWTITGTYSSANLLQNPTTSDTKFQFDDAQFSNSGDVIYLESPVVDLSAAFTANEKVLIISLDMAFTLTASTSEALGIQYWDDDANSGAGAWVLMPDGQPNSGDSQGTYTSCISPGAFPIYFDFKNFSTNQLQNFKYRFFYNDGGLATGKGLCIAAPSISSSNITCNAPTALHTTSLGFDSAQIGWTANSSETQWDVEYGLAGFSQGTGIVQNTDVNPHGINGLSANTGYDVYVRANCIPTMAGGAVYSSWSTKLNFTTTNVPCTQPSGGLANQLKPTSVNLTWAPQGSESAWNVEYGPVGYTRGSAQSLGSFSATSSSSNTISGLTESTMYEFYVMADCGGGSTSAWSGPYGFITAAYTLGFYNLQWPQNGSINAGDAFDVYAQVWSEQKTDVAGQTAAASDIKVWIGWSTTNTNPNTWPEGNWIPANFNTSSLSTNNDEYTVDLGATLTTAGTYYYASRFQLFTEAYVYGGFQNAWQMGVSDSGVLTVTGTLAVGDQVIEGFNFYPNPIKDNMTLNAQENIEQVELYNLLGQQVMIKQPNVATYQMNVSALKTGVYFMKVKVGDKTGTYKVVRQ
jgi:type IX secretion system substrate protein/fibronectin type III domain protein